MHKRTGKVITLKDLIDDTSVNAVRFYFSKYSLDTQMDFDIDLARSSSMIIRYIIFVMHMQEYVLY